VSNTERDPNEILCETADAHASVDILAPRDVPLGGLRAMTVRRTLPQRQRSLIGAWCFLDHYGPDRVSERGGMSVPRHPHTGLQTVSWLFTGQIEHRDSAGFRAVVRPGELNLMTAGRGISHSEFSTPDTEVLHGAQLWVALPERAREMEPTFEHFRPEPLHGDGWSMRVFLGSLGGSTSPVITHTPLLGAEILVEADARLTLELDPGFEHGILVDAGDLVLDGTSVAKDHLAYTPVGRSALTLLAGAEPVRLLLIGGMPLGEQILMWWNFVGRSHEEIVAYRTQWQLEIGAADGDITEPRFGNFPEGEPAPIPAPPLPTVRLRPRG
jgi:hypothetical protein